MISVKENSVNKFYDFNYKKVLKKSKTIILNKFLIL